MSSRSVRGQMNHLRWGSEFPDEDIHPGELNLFYRFDFHITHSFSSCSTYISAFIKSTLLALPSPVQPIEPYIENHTTSTHSIEASTPSAQLGSIEAIALFAEFRHLTTESKIPDSTRHHVFYNLVSPLRQRPCKPNNPGAAQYDSRPEQSNS